MRALIVIDVQNVYDGGPLRIVHPPLGTSLPNITDAMRTARDAGIPVVIIQTTPPGAPAELIEQGAWALHPAIVDEPRDLLVYKHLPSSFAGTELDTWLRDRGVDTLTLVGYMTHNCVDATARDATHRGYTVEVLDDATGTLPYANAAGTVDAATLHTTTLVALHARFAAVASTRAWLDAVAAEAALPRGDVMESARRGAELAGFTGSPVPVGR